MSTTHPRLTRTQRLNRVAVILWVAAIILFGVAGFTGWTPSGVTALTLVGLGVWASYKADTR